LHGRGCHFDTVRKRTKKPRLSLVTPSTVFGPVTRGKPPQRRPNAESRSREYLKNDVVERLIKAAGNSRYALRDPPIVTGCGSASWYHCAGTASTFAIARFTLRRKGSSASVHH
jgi:hypothetical protein